MAVRTCALQSCAPRFRHAFLSLLVFTPLSLPLIGGCGGDTGGRVPLAGTVDIGGTPLDRGTIEFHPMGDGVTTGGMIRNGHFEIPARQGALPGQHEVRIYAADLSGQPMDDPNVPPGESDRPLQPELIANRYNLESELKADIGDGGNADLTFNLEE